MRNSFTGIKEPAECLIVEKKSRFYSFAYPVFSKSEINKILDDYKKKYYDATHICYAYVVNDDGVSEKFSDDGEPSGTAGYPICSVIKKRGLTNVLVIVVRYFGKIKLGAGGLTRAYSTCSGSVLDKAGIHEYMPANKITVKFFVNNYYKFTGIINSFMVREKTEVFEEDMCKLTLHVEQKYTDEVLSKIRLADSDAQTELAEFYL